MLCILKFSCLWGSDECMHFFPGGVAFWVEFHDIWLSEGGLGSLFGPFWMPWVSLEAPGTSSVDFCANECSKFGCPCGTPWLSGGAFCTLSSIGEPFAT